MTEWSNSRRRSAIVTIIPVAVPSTMAAVFTALARRMPERTAYNVGFAVYWIAWCLAVPVWLLGARQAVRLLTAGRRLPRDHFVLLALPVAGAVVTQLIPHRRDIDTATALVMVGSAMINATGEELLWRGVFMRELEDRPRMAQTLSLLGFSTWHYAPQLILPSPLGRGRFVAGSAVVGSAMNAAAWKAGGLRQVLIAHAIVDACGVTAARFRLGRGPNS
ncbi:CPBP family intramembrane glutamic endopeptidase [Mycobacterium sp. Z3061]|uniref:CPBP family intramembrane glutamic endopeptidase n=1 Tax=Mycobacterium sp. Z3061 TaxID=3073562 RepID=UPI002872FD65|nr:CPBP family intramembrane glutamic endopeptidase [Mycobacterium sp. Z3061]